MQTKRITILVCLLIFNSYAFTTFAQNLTSADIPAAVNTTFTAQFPSAQNTTWEKNGSTFQAFFTSNNGKKFVAEFNNNGILLANNHEINYTELPSPVQQTIANQFAGFTHHKVRKLESPAAIDMYELTLTKGKDVKVVKLTAQGKVL